ncbi:nucleotidyl transferase AbiEii/AbiGii toxin family protein [Candidatus Woesearchaeota archaeon]|nr:nucleotidyl transferase AbiEii/AbiGii toxin family protein [Candidatus Woesearchaeota archaeon]
MPINFFQLDELSRKVQLSLENTEKELFHNILLYSLFNIPKLKKYTRYLAFKGGTCLYKCYGFPRFSEDLDFDVLAGKLSKKDIELLFNKHLTDILRETFGFGTVNFRIKENPTGFNIHTDIRGPAFSQTHRDCHLKFDLSLRKRLIYGIKEVKHDASLFLKEYGIEQIISLKVVDPREISAEKIIAILDKNFIFCQRDEARDLFDLYVLFMKSYACKLEDLKKKLPIDKKDVFTLKNFSDSIYHTAKSREWDFMVRQLIIEPKLKKLGLLFEDINFNKISKYVMDKVNSLYF